MNAGQYKTHLTNPVKILQSPDSIISLKQSSYLSLNMLVALLAERHFLCGSCHFVRAPNDEFSVEFFECLF